MGKLMKYEFRKTRMSRLILLLATIISEVLFLAGLFAEWETGLVWGSVLISLCATFGIFYMGIESILVFSRDMNTKQSYMLFMTPKNSYQILGAKALENLICILLAGVIFILIAFGNLTIASIYLDGLNQFLEEMHRIMGFLFENLPTWQEIVAGVFSFLLDWFMMITVGYLAVALSATILAGKRFSGLISFVLFLAIIWASSAVMEFLPVLSGQTADFILKYSITLLLSAVFYLLTGWILEQKLSV